MMHLADIAVWTVVVLHVCFFVLESLLWTHPVVCKQLGQTEQEASVTKILALNQGVYNLGIAAMLAWFMYSQVAAGVCATLLFIVVMGIVGALTANVRIMLIQSLPAAIALWLQSV
jgi:putative membrane protein